MMSTTDTELRMLLLRRLPAAEAERLDEAILLQDGFAERLRSEELDLIDDYAASRLSVEDARDVERYLLTTEESRHSLRVARALLQVRNGTESDRKAVTPVDLAAGSRWRRAPVWRVATLLAACLAIVVYLPQWRSPSSHLESGPKASTPVMPIIALVADVNRGPRPSLYLPAAAGAVRFQVEVPDPVAGKRYSLRIEDAAGRGVFAAATLEVHTAGHYHFVETVVPIQTLGPGDRTISLAGPGFTDAETDFTWHVTGVIR